MEMSRVMVICAIELIGVISKTKDTVDLQLPQAQISAFFVWIGGGNLIYRGPSDG